VLPVSLLLNKVLPRKVAVALLNAAAEIVIVHAHEGQREAEVAVVEGCVTRAGRTPFSRAASPAAAYGLIGGCRLARDEPIATETADPLCGWHELKGEKALLRLPLEVAQLATDECSCPKLPPFAVRLELIQAVHITDS